MKMWWGIDSSAWCMYVKLIELQENDLVGITRAAGEWFSRDN
jgi:hypothetical protein